jgi:hypothetical protein
LKKLYPIESGKDHLGEDNLRPICVWGRIVGYLMELLDRGVDALALPF